MSSIKIDGGILAGGLSSRMQGQDKGLQSYQGMAMVDCIADQMRPFVDRLIINCNQNQDAYRLRADQICSDEITGFKGPLAGLHCLLKVSRADYMLISPCDTPRLTYQYGERMCAELIQTLERYDSPAKPIAVSTPEKKHPLHVILHRSYVPILEASLKQGERRVMKWMEEQQAIWLPFDENIEQFDNINTLQDLVK